MKQLLYIFFLTIITSSPDSLLGSSSEHIDQALAWLDTTECTSDTLIVELPDSIYKQRLQALPFVIEMPYHEIVRRYILRYTKHNPRQLASLQRKAEYYFPIFEDILAKHDLPLELCYLPVIESALNPQV